MWQVGETPAEQVDKALALVVGAGRPEGQARAGARDLRDYLDSLPAGRHAVWWARAGPSPAAATVVIHSPGRTATVLHSSAAGGAVPVEALAALMRAVADHALAAGAVLVQVLLAPPADEDIRAFTQAGFVRLAELIYMRLSLRGRSVAPPAATAQLEYASYGPGTHADFAAGIVASYVESLDCPGLGGLRDVEDVLAGHKACGVFRPELWTVARQCGQLAGVILLNEHLVQPALEVVYMGVARAFRGQGVGRALLWHAMYLAQKERFPALSLAVDAENRFARRLYADVGFVETARRLAYVRK